MLNPLICKCPICGKEFEPTGEWAYRKGTATLCSWHCLREMEKLHAQRERKTRSNEAVFTYKGVTKTIREWSKESGIAYNTLYQRLYRGQADPFVGGRRNG